MRIMLDTNVLVSLLLFPGQRMNAMMEHIFAEHELVLSSFVVDELKEVVHRKFPAKEKVVDKLLLHMSYNLVYTPQEMDKTMFRIRDAKDYPVLYTAILEDVDILITGDKDFAAVGIEKPELMTPTEFMAKYL
jgi:putative PIN family toxin of toxin-antitoxin system